MIKKMKTRVTDAQRKCRARVREVAASVGSRIRGLWRQHRDRVNNNHDYAAALGAAAAALAALFTEDPALLAVVAALVALYVAIHHATGHGRPWEPPTSPPSGPDPWR